MSEHTATTPAASDRVYRPGVTPELSPAELAAACAEAGLTPELVAALGGAAINTVFMNHFQAMARGHFVVRRLERHYGKDVVRDAYALLPRRG